MFNRIVIGLISGAIGGLVIVNIIEAFFGVDLYGFESVISRSISIFSGMIIGIIVCLIIEVAELKKRTEN